jgi:hypothetical protein
MHNYKELKIWQILFQGFQPVSRSNILLNNIQEVQKMIFGFKHKISETH